jgi:hypothetical protein
VSHRQSVTVLAWVSTMLNAGVRLQAAEHSISRDRSRSASVLADLFDPLNHLLSRGGDPRLSIDSASGTNAYGCQPSPSPSALSFASSTATSISQRAYERAETARESLMRSAIAVGIDAAFDERFEAMRGELKTHLQLSQSEVDVVFSPSGTDSQLQSLFLARALLGPALTTVIVAADQTGSGTAYTARGHHFSAATANGSAVCKGEPITGLAHSVASVALDVFDEAGQAYSQAEMDVRVLAAVETAIGQGRRVLLQIMDSSKLGWRAPSDSCLDEIWARWPGQVQVVVDACQMRLGRPRLKQYLARGYVVIVTGSKFFTGPPFSGALLIPAALSKILDAVADVAPGLLDYSNRSDWPMSLPRLRSRFPVRANFGQWLRWEAALEEIRAYYSVPDEFRRSILSAFGEGVERIIASSPSLRLLPAQERREARRADDEELSQRTVFPFMIARDGQLLSLEDCRKIYRALGQDIQSQVASDAGEREAEIAAKICLVGQPVALAGREGRTVAALRICAGARLVTEAWSSDPNVARQNVRRELDRVGTIVAKIEWLLAHMPDLSRIY